MNQSWSTSAAAAVVNLSDSQSAASAPTNNAEHTHHMIEAPWL
jgi:hypothetical protein